MRFILFMMIVLFCNGFASGHVVPFLRQTSIDGNYAIETRIEGGVWGSGVLIGESWHRLSPNGFAGAMSGDGLVVVGEVHYGDESDYLPGMWELESSGDEYDYTFRSLDLLPGYGTGGAGNVSLNGEYIIGTNLGDDLQWRGCYWDSQYVVHDLGSIYDADVLHYTLPISVSDTGVIVGQVFKVGENYTEAFIWDKDNGMRRLKVVLEQEFGYDLAGWELWSAHNISPDGRWISGDGYYNEDIGVYWSIPIPEPCSFLLFGFGFVFLRGRRS